jgi:hypothetical protein
MTVISTTIKTFIIDTLIDNVSSRLMTNLELVPGVLWEIDHYSNGSSSFVSLKRNNKYIIFFYLRYHAALLATQGLVDWRVAETHYNNFTTNAKVSKSSILVNPRQTALPELLNHLYMNDFINFKYEAVNSITPLT